MPHDLHDSAELLDTADLDWGTFTLRELLAIISGIFDDLHDASTETDDVRHRQGSCLRRAPAEVSQRAVDISPPLRLACSCGATFTTDDALDEHFYEVFVPAHDIGLDGQLHVELSTE